MILRANANALDIGILADIHYDDVWRFCYRRVGTAGADDACQQTFIAAQKSAKKYRGESEPKTWLLGIAANVCSNQLRKGKQLFFSQQIESDIGHDPSHLLDQKIVLQQALSNLTRDQQTIILLHEIEGYTQEEISKILSIPEGTVKSRLFYAIKALKAQLGVTA